VSASKSSKTIKVIETVLILSSHEMKHRLVAAKDYQVVGDPFNTKTIIQKLP
jgi:hypothetical protein